MGQTSFYSTGDLVGQTSFYFMGDLLGQIVSIPQMT